MTVGGADCRWPWYGVQHDSGLHRTLQQASLPQGVPRALCLQNPSAGLSPPGRPQGSLPVLLCPGSGLTTSHPLGAWPAPVGPMTPATRAMFQNSQQPPKSFRELPLGLV